MINANFKLLTKTAKLPIFGNNDTTNAGIDIYADQDILIPAGQSRLIKTGIAWSPIFKFYAKILSLFFKIEMQLRSRSGLSTKHSLEVGAGTIDCTYRAEIGVHLYNHGFESYQVRCGDRIAQGVISILPKVKVTEIQLLDDTKRGKDGFGSTGK